LSKTLAPKTVEALSGKIESAEELHKRIAVLERKSAREKKARNLAENQLEQYSLDIYQTNQSLKNALAFSTKKQYELEYLGKAAVAVTSELSLNDMIRKIVELTCHYCNTEYGFYFVTEHGVVVDDKFDKAWSKKQGWQSQSELQKLVNVSLPLNEVDVLESWFVSAVSDDHDQHLEHFGWLLYMNFALSGGKVGWLAFLSQIELVDKDIFPVLVTARDHLKSGIRRRLTDIRILKRNMQLQDSINNLESAKRQLIQSEKMASLGQLAAGVAHEINNPVAFIRSNMEVLSEYLKDYKKLHDALKSQLGKHKNLDMLSFDTLCEKVDLAYIDEDSADILTSNIEGLDRIKEIVDNLKGFSHAGDEVIIEMSLSECIQGSLKIAGNALNYEHKVENQIPDICPRIMGNLGQLQQVFVNLFVNAAYAMDGGGRMTISHTESNERVIVHVKDTGSGMDKDTVKRLFTPFFTTKPVGVGTGLGLSVSYTILEAHDAQITVDSKIGIGTTFNLSFPVST
jgi:signal transduction histidine kinase